MQKGEGVDPFLTKIQEVIDQLATVGEAPQPTEIVQLALNSLRGLASVEVARWSARWSGGGR